MKRRDFLRLALSALVVFPLSGCWGKEEAENLGFVLAIGVDKGENPGTYRVTYQMGVPKKAGEGGQDIANLTYCAEGYSMRDTLDEVSGETSKKPFVGTVRTLLIGEEVAKDGINAVLDFFQRYFEFRRTIYLVLCEGKAEDILHIKTRDQRLPAFTIQAIIERSKTLSTFPLVRLGHYLTVLATASTAPVIPIIGKVRPVGQKAQENSGTEELKVTGAGAFQGDRLQGILNETETKGYMWLTNGVEERSLTATWQGEQGEEAFSSGRVVNSSTDFQLQPEGEGYGILYKVKTQINLDEYHGDQVPRNAEEWRELKAKEIMPAFQRVIARECEAACQKGRDLRLDILGVGRHIEEKKPAYWKTIKDQWTDIYSGFPVQVEVETKAGNGGAVFNPPTNPPGKGEE